MEKTRRHETLARALGRLISHRQRLGMPERGQCFRHPAGEEAVTDIQDAETLATSAGISPDNLKCEKQTGHAAEPEPEAPDHPIGGALNAVECADEIEWIRRRIGGDRRRMKIWFCNCR